MSSDWRVEAEAHLPLKPVVFHILLALAEGDAHGYGVIQRVREGSGGRVDLQTGPFYRHLRKLLEAGLVAEVAGPTDDDARRGSYYHLTTSGREVVAAEGRRLATLLADTRRLGLLEGGVS